MFHDLREDIQHRSRPSNWPIVEADLFALQGCQSELLEAVPRSIPGDAQGSGVLLIDVHAPKPKPKPGSSCARVGIA